MDTINSVIAWTKNHPTETVMIAAAIIVLVIGGIIGHAV